MSMAARTFGAALVFACVALLTLSESAAARGFLLSPEKTVEVKIDGQTTSRAAGSEVMVGQTVEALQTPVSVAFPDGAILVLDSGSAFTVEDYRTGADNTLTLGLGQGRFYFRSGSKFESEAYTLNTALGQPITLLGTALYVAQPQPGQIIIEVTEGSVSFGGITISPEDEAVLITYRVENGRLIVESSQGTTSIASEMESVVALFDDYVGSPGSGVPVDLLVELGLPSEVVAAIMAAAENPLQTSPR